MGADPSLDAFAEEVARPDPAVDLARAALAIARLEYPRLETGTYLDRLEALAGEARAARQTASPLERLHRLREYLFGELGFRGNAREYFDPRNSYLNEVMDRRLGIPLTLSLILMEVGRRLGLHMEGIGLPGHFIAAARVGGEQILLDPFHGGTIVTVEGCGDLVARALGRPVRLTEAHFAPVTKRQLLARMLLNLKGIYWRREAWARVVAVSDRLLVLEPEAAEVCRDRGTALSRLGELARGLADWERYLTRCPGAEDHEQVRSLLRRGRQRLARLN